MGYVKGVNDINSKEHGYEIYCTRSELFYFLKEISLWNQLRLLLRQKHFDNSLNINVVRSQTENIDYKW